MTAETVTVVTLADEQLGVIVGGLVLLLVVASAILAAQLRSR